MILLISIKEPQFLTIKKLVNMLNLKLTIYIKEQEESFVLKEKPDVSMQEGCVFGVSLDSDGTADYDKAMIGYISHIAEFDSVLDAEHVKAYMQNPPYFYEPNLTANYTFYNDKAIDIKSGKELGLYGKGGGLVLVEDAREEMQPESFSIYIPEVEDPAWETYTEDEKWQIQWMAERLEESYVILFGAKEIQRSENIGWYRRIAGLLYRFTRRRYYRRLMGMTPNVTIQAFMQWLHHLDTKPELK